VAFVIVIPAIDILGGKCVRLFQGDYARETVFSDCPWDMALRWAEAGARWLHVVDLDAAKDGQAVNLDAIKAILSTVDIPVELGGGIRTMEDAEQVLSLGVRRIILGTVALENPAIVAEAVRRWNGAVAVGIDARNGMAATHGWLETSDTPAVELARKLSDIGVNRFIYTDINRDGALTEPNFAAVKQFVEEIPAKVIASGGVATVDHLLMLDSIGVEAAIVGQALYTGQIDLAAAIESVG
jgi:phosphoribosylformimino-5-aminoimidazole carboxamide ribotide isomerase